MSETKRFKFPMGQSQGWVEYTRKTTYGHVEIGAGLEYVVPTIEEVWPEIRKMLGGFKRWTGSSGRSGLCLFDVPVEHVDALVAYLMEYFRVNPVRVPRPEQWFPHVEAQV